MRLLLDEMLSAVIAEQLRARGHDVEAINRNSLHEARSDREALDVARADRRAVVTDNLVDFRVLYHEAITFGRPGHFGMIFLAGNYRRTKADTGRIVTALQSELDQFSGEDDPVNGETWP